MRCARHDYERGAALLVVLWTTVLIAGLATIVSGTVRTDLTVTRYQLSGSAGAPPGASWLDARRIDASGRGGSCSHERDNCVF